MAGEFADVEQAVRGRLVDAVTAIRRSLTNPLYKKPVRCPTARSPARARFPTALPRRAARAAPSSRIFPPTSGAVDEGRYEDALNIIIERNALPFITGTICPHPCGACERAFYEPEGAQIRASKLKAAREAMTAVLPKLRAQARQRRRAQRCRYRRRPGRPGDGVLPDARRRARHHLRGPRLARRRGPSRDPRVPHLRRRYLPRCRALPGLWRQGAAQARGHESSSSTTRASPTWSWPPVPGCPALWA